MKVFIVNIVVGKKYDSLELKYWQILFYKKLLSSKSLEQGGFAKGVQLSSLGHRLTDFINCLGVGLF